MKKVILISFLAVIALQFSACKSETKKADTTENESKSTAAYSLKTADNQINFTAYKFTEKTPVGGQFQKVDILAGGEGASIKEAIHNTEFSIPVSSIFTKDSGRDYKIKKFFFGVMDKTQLLSGKLLISDDTSGVAEIKMNGVTEKVPFTYTIENNTFAMSATMDVYKWNAQAALESLNKICYELHKGKDGVSKTWSDVALNITSTF